MIKNLPMLKIIARKILKRELEKNSQEISQLRQEKRKLLSDYSSMLEEFGATQIHAQNELKKAKEKIQELEYQNAVLRKYYSLDEEPSEEVKDKMRIDVKCHEMELEITRLAAMVNSTPRVIYSPAYMPPQYSPFNYPRLY